MMILKIIRKKKILLLNLFLTLYIATNLIGGERGLVSFFEKKNIENSLSNKENKLVKQINEIKKKNKLLSEKIDLDYLDIVYREKLKQGYKNEIIIKLK